MSEETKSKLSLANSGKPAPATAFKSGSEHPRWKGGISLDGCKDRSKSYQKEYLRNIRKATIDVLGSVCKKCGFADIRALQIDHINGEGSRERKNRTYKGNFHKHVLESFLAGEEKYQLLCANCNWIKRFENNEHKKL